MGIGRDMKFWEMNEIEELSDEAYVELLPDNFLLDPEGHCRQYGQTEYYRLVTMVICIHSCRLVLNNGDKLNYVDTTYLYAPLNPIAANN